MSTCQRPNFVRKKKTWDFAGKLWRWQSAWNCCVSRKHHGIGEVNPCVSCNSSLIPNLIKTVLLVVPLGGGRILGFSNLSNHMFFLLQVSFGHLKSHSHWTWLPAIPSSISARTRPVWPKVLAMQNKTPRSAHLKCHEVTPRSSKYGFRWCELHKRYVLLQTCVAEINDMVWTAWINYFKQTQTVATTITQYHLHVSDNASLWYRNLTWSTGRYEPWH